MNNKDTMKHWQYWVSSGILGWIISVIGYAAIHPGKPPITEVDLFLIPGFILLNYVLWRIL